MFGIDITVLLVIALVAVAAGGIAYTVMFPSIETQNNTQKRLNRVRAQETDISALKQRRDRDNEIAKRRRSVQDSLNDLEEKQKRKTNYSAPPLKIALQQTGWGVSMTQFYIASVMAALIFGLVSLILGAPWYLAAGMLVVEEAGGLVTDTVGQPLDFGHGHQLPKNRGVLVSNGKIHTKLLQAIADTSTED